MRGTTTGAEPLTPPRFRRRDRRAADVAGLLVSALIVMGAAALAWHGRALAVEIELFRLVNGIPAWLGSPLLIAMQAGALASVAVAAGAALVARRPRLARDLFVSGMLSYWLAKFVKAQVVRGRPKDLLHDVLIHGWERAGGLGFLSGHAVVAAALATATAPYLGQRGRFAAWTVVVLAALGRVWSGHHLPLDVIGGAALGCMVGSAVHLLFGTPRRLSAVASKGAAEDSEL